MTLSLAIMSCSGVCAQLALNYSSLRTGQAGPQMFVLVPLGRSHLQVHCACFQPTCVCFHHLVPDVFEQVVSAQQEQCCEGPQGGWGHQGDT